MNVLSSVPDSKDSVNLGLQSVASLDMLTEVRSAMKKLIEDKITDFEFNLNNKIITRIENLERSTETFINTAQSLDSRYAIDNRRLNKMEETMNEHINIIEKMNLRLKNFIENQEESKGLLL